MPDENYFGAALWQFSLYNPKCEEAIYLVFESLFLQPFQAIAL